MLSLHSNQSIFRIPALDCIYLCEAGNTQDRYIQRLRLKLRCFFFQNRELFYKTKSKEDLKKDDIIASIFS